MHGLPTNVPGIGPQDAQAMLDNGEALMIDVREPHERQHARIPGTRHIPMMQIPARAAAELPQEATLIMQCHSGHRSNDIGRWLTAQGYRDILNLEGGIVAWHQAGLPIESG